MRVLNAVRRGLMLLLLVPVAAICLDTLLRAFGARAQNPIVSTVRDVRDWFVLDAFTDVFPDQTYWQTALVALAAYGLVALVVGAMFRGLRSVVAARPPAQRQRAEAAADADGTPDEARASGSSADASDTDAASASASADGDAQRSPS